MPCRQHAGNTPAACAVRLRLRILNINMYPRFHSSPDIFVCSVAHCAIIFGVWCSTLELCCVRALSVALIRQARLATLCIRSLLVYFWEGYELHLPSGTYKFASGSIYEGDFVDGHLSGKGRAPFFSPFRDCDFSPYKESGCWGSGSVCTCCFKLLYETRLGN